MENYLKDYVIIIVFNKIHFMYNNIFILLCVNHIYASLISITFNINEYKMGGVLTIYSTFYKYQ